MYRSPNEGTCARSFSFVQAPSTTKPTSPIISSRSPSVVLAITIFHRVFRQRVRRCQPVYVRSCGVVFPIISSGSFPWLAVFLLLCFNTKKTKYSVKQCNRISKEHAEKFCNRKIEKVQKHKYLLTLVNEAWEYSVEEVKYALR